MSAFQKRFILSPFILIAVFSTIISIAFAQKKESPNDHGIKLTWQARDNKYEGRNESLSVLTITNSSSTPIPNSGWTIYFNSGGTFLNPENHGLLVSYINGDLYKIEP